MKKFLSLFLSIAIIISMTGIISFAEDLNSVEFDGKTYNLTNEHPWVFVHGMGGWADYNGEAYWGGWADSEGDAIKMYNDAGVEAYAAVVGPFSSVWDRACELYAQLTGTVVDYGVAHSKAHNHDRFGYDYTDNILMGEAWDMESAINLVGHSLGGPTVTLFTSLLAYGDDDEIAASGDDISPLFTGGHANAVNAVVTFSGVHNGSPVANVVMDNGFFSIISVGINLIGAIFGSKILMFDLQFGHFGITPRQDEKRAKFSMDIIKNFANANDNCGYDLTLRGAAELNKKIKTVDSVYYYSYSCIASKETALGTQVPIASNFIMFIPSSLYIGTLGGKTIDGVYMDDNWVTNDGIVPLASALYPSTAAETAKNYEEAVANGETIETGRWYYMNPMVGFDHFDFCGTIDYLTSFEDFYYSLIETVNSTN